MPDKPVKTTKGSTPGLSAGGTNSKSFVNKLTEQLRDDWGDKQGGYQAELDDFEDFLETIETAESDAVMGEQPGNKATPQESKLHNASDVGADDVSPLVTVEERDSADLTVDELLAIETARDVSTTRPPIDEVTAAEDLAFGSQQPRISESGSDHITAVEKSVEARQAEEVILANDEDTLLILEQESGEIVDQHEISDANISAVETPVVVDATVDPTIDVITEADVTAAEADDLDDLVAEIARDSKVKVDTGLREVARSAEQDSPFAERAKVQASEASTDQDVNPREQAKIPVLKSIYEPGDVSPIKVALDEVANAGKVAVNEDQPDAAVIADLARVAQEPLASQGGEFMRNARFAAMFLAFCGSTFWLGLQYGASRDADAPEVVYADKGELEQIKQASPAAATADDLLAEEEALDIAGADDLASNPDAEIAADSLLDAGIDDEASAARDTDATQDELSQPAELAVAEAEAESEPELAPAVEAETADMIAAVSDATATTGAGIVETGAATTAQASDAEAAIADIASEAGSLTEDTNVAVAEPGMFEANVIAANEQSDIEQNTVSADTDTAANTLAAVESATANGEDFTAGRSSQAAATSSGEALENDFTEITSLQPAAGGAAQAVSRDGRPVLGSTAPPASIAVLDERVAQPAPAPRAAEIIEVNINEILADYQKQITGLILANVNYPSRAISRSQQGRVKVSLVIDRNGKVLDMNILEDPGHKLLVKASEKAIRKTKRLPPLPAEYPDDSVRVTVPIAFKLP